MLLLTVPFMIPAVYQYMLSQHWVVGSYLKLGGQVVMWGANQPPLVEIGPTYLPKLVWVIVHPAHPPQPSPTFVQQKFSEQFCQVEKHSFDHWYEKPKNMFSLKLVTETVLRQQCFLATQSMH